MSYRRPNKPAFYISNYDYLISRGNNVDDILTVNGESADNNYLFIDDNPWEQATFSVNGDSTNIFINIDLGSTLPLSVDTLAILNHNLHDAGAKVEVHQSPSLMTEASQGYIVPHFEAIFGGSSSGGIITPDSGKDLLAYSAYATTGRYAALVIKPSGSTYTDDISLGLLILGSRYVMPQSGDLSMTLGYLYDSVRVKESVGGKRYTTANWTSAATTGRTYVPFGAGDYKHETGGREYIEMSFSYVDDTDLIADGSTSPAHITTFAMLVSRTAGQLNPFIFTPDSSSTDAKDYLWARFAGEDTQYTQQAWRSWGMKKIRIEQEF